ncbi:MAG TPA: hypothetical protein VEA19_07275 [Actinomycetota bacterium]|nr:hypothetical protein [Actinomycetota bacterium]
MVSRRIAFVVSLLTVLSVTPLSLASHQGDSLNDLRVTQVDAPDPVVEAGFVAYTLTVSNRGPHPAQDIRVEHGTTGTTVAASGQKWECLVVSLLNRTSCVHHGALPSGGQAAPLRIVVQAPTLEQASSVTSTADVSSHGNELQPADNHSVEVTTIEEGDDLSVSQFDEPQEVTADHLVRYVISVSNHGNTVATGVELTESVSGGTLEQAGGDGWTCSVTSGSASCALNGDLPPSTTAAAVGVLVRAPETTTSSSITATAAVSGDRGDRFSSDNTAVETTTVQASGQDRATGYIPAAGGFITTNPSGEFTEAPNGGAAGFAASALGEVATPSDSTIGDVRFPAGPGGVASLFEGPSTSQLQVCALPVANCAGAALDVIVPPGYNDPESPIEVNLIYDASVAPVSEGNRTVYVEKPVNGIPTTLVLPDCQLLGIANPSPCVDFQVRLADGDLLIRILMLSQDPKYQG